MADATITGRPQAGWKETIEVLSDADIMKQLDEGKKKGTKIRDFESLAKELGI